MVIQRTADLSAARNTNRRAEGRCLCLKMPVDAIRGSCVGAAGHRGADTRMAHKATILLQIELTISPSVCLGLELCAVNHEWSSEAMQAGRTWASPKCLMGFDREQGEVRKRTRLPFA